MKRKTITKQGRRAVLAACGLLIGASVVQSCKDEILTGQPDWLGNSIYERLQEEGSYTTMLHLIDDLDQAEVLGHTGSKTLFAADDQAFAEWFRTNSWGVRSYEQLSQAQKKLLLNNSMINNAYLIELMSNVSGTPPREGRAMRRETATTIYDSVYIMPPSAMPNTIAWADFKSRGKSIPIFKDATAAPMIHFLPAYMRFNKISNEDLAILTNHQATSINEAWVNGKRVVERDITCKNGYIQKVDGVIESNPNMAEILRQHPQMSMWSGLLDRFSAPYYNATGTREYNRIYNNEDSVYTLRYYSSWSYGNAPNQNRPDGETAEAYLDFDPGWNHYMYDNTMDYDLHYDAGAMIVPTNAALQAWWNNEGKDLQDEYKEWDSIPDGTLVKLLNVNMLPDFAGRVPSRFDNVLNDAKEPLGITIEDVDSCFMGCNGVVYMVNKVFSPAEYSAVSYPALAHASTMNVIYWGISIGTERLANDDQKGRLNFLPYLLSMDSKYAMMLPDNNAMLYYIDPSSYGKLGNAVAEGTADTIMVESPDLIMFRYIPSNSLNSRVRAERWSCSVDANGNIVPNQRVQADVNRANVDRMLQDLINQLIIVLPDETRNIDSYVDEGYTYFKTKGGTLINVQRDAQGHYSFMGGWQMEHNNKALPSISDYTKQNGMSFILDNQMPLGAQHSLYMTLKEHPEYTAFLNLLENDYSHLLAVTLSGNKYKAGNVNQGSKNLRLFDNYNYTVYVPTTESIEALQSSGILPTNAELEIGTEEEVLDSICRAEGWYELKSDRDSVKQTVLAAIESVITNFLRYHVHDHSVAIGMVPERGMKDNLFESMMRNPETGRFFPLAVDYSNTGISLKDVMGNVRHVIQTPGLYNNMCREYWFEGTGNTARLFMASDAMVHLIDGPLYYEQLKPWRQVVREALTKQ